LLVTVLITNENIMNYDQLLAAAEHARTLAVVLDAINRRFARNEQQIQVAQAQGRLDAAELRKQAEIIDASAVAASIEIIGKKLHENEGYLRWKWIEMMDGTKNATIYVPTDGNLPVLEASRFLTKKTGD